MTTCWSCFISFRPCQAFGTSGGGGASAGASDHSPSRTASSSRAECVVCMDAARSVRFQPCQHAVCCGPCATVILDTTGRCPLCAGAIASSGAMGGSQATFVSVASNSGPSAAVRFCPCPQTTADIFSHVRRSHSISFTRAQGIPKCKTGVGRGKGWERCGKIG